VTNTSSEEQEQEQEREWRLVRERIENVLQEGGAKNIEGGVTDYTLDDCNLGLYRHKLKLHKPELMEPEIIKSLQSLLIEHPNWEIIIVLEILGGGVIIRDDEVIDGLQRDRLPERFQAIVYDGSRALGSRFGDIMYSGLTISLRPGPFSIRLPDDFDFMKFIAPALDAEPSEDS
jgi:hypothetical protein